MRACVETWFVGFGWVLLDLESGDTFFQGWNNGVRVSGFVKTGYGVGR